MLFSIQRRQLGSTRRDGSVQRCFCLDGTVVRWVAGRLLGCGCERLRLIDEVCRAVSNIWSASFVKSCPRTHRLVPVGDGNRTFGATTLSDPQSQPLAGSKQFGAIRVAEDSGNSPCSAGMPDPNFLLPGPMERGLVNPARAGRQQRCLFRVCRGYPGTFFFDPEGSLRDRFRQVRFRQVRNQFSSLITGPRVWTSS